MVRTKTCSGAHHLYFCCAPKVVLVRTICVFAAHQNPGRCAPESYSFSMATISSCSSGVYFMNLNQASSLDLCNRVP